MSCKYFDAGYCTNKSEHSNRNKQTGACFGTVWCQVYASEFRRMPDSVDVVMESPYDRIYTLNEQEITQRQVIFDYYKISDMIGLTDPWLNHAGKKVLFGGRRGHKAMVKDIEEAIETLQKKLAYLREHEA